MEAADDNREKIFGALPDDPAALRYIIDRSPVGMAMHDRSGRIEYVNGKFVSLFGYALAEIPDRDAWSVKAAPDPADRAAQGARWSEALKKAAAGGGEIAPTEFRFACKDGSFRDVIVSGVLCGDKVFAMFEDETERVEAGRALRESESLYRALVETTRTGYVVLDMEGRVTDANLEYVRLSGHRDLKEIMGRSVLEWSAAHNKREAWEAVLLAVRDGRVLNFELDYSGPSGGLTPVEVNATAVTREGRPRIIGLCRDITERRKTEAELLSLNRDLEKKVELRTAELMQAQKMEILGLLAGGIAHDFNNVLASIAGSADLLRLSLPEGLPAADGLDEIVKEAKRGSLLTRQLTALSRKDGLRMQEMDLGAAAESSCKMLNRLMGRGVRLETRLSPEAGTILADAGQVSQVIMNLVINARDAIEGEGTITVSTGREELGSARPGMPLAPPPGVYAVLSVRDTGSGMTPETRARLFEPLFTTKPAGKGTGLGLSIVYGAVSRLGGGIAVESSPGRGSEFKVYFPLQ